MRIYFRFGRTWLKYAPPNFTRQRAREIEGGCVAGFSSWLMLSGSNYP